MKTDTELVIANKTAESSALSFQQTETRKPSYHSQPRAIRPQALHSLSNNSKASVIHT